MTETFYLFNPIHVIKLLENPDKYKLILTRAIIALQESNEVTIKETIGNKTIVVTNIP